MPARDPLAYLDLIAALCARAARLTNSMSLDGLPRLAAEVSVLTAEITER